MSEESEPSRKSNFLYAIIEKDLAAGKHQQIQTRFPPEPNGYLHIGHAKSICLNFGVAQDFNGACNLRFDDTNPAKEDIEFVEAIKNDIKWLGFSWTKEEALFGSDYFEQIYAFAVELINKGKAYVCDLSEEEFREYRGTITSPGKPSPYRDRAVDENLDLFARMRAGEFADGEKVLRGKIDMTAPNMKLRDPPLYRIRRDAHHYRTGDTWKIYPMYDFQHCLSDALEGVTHSLCTLEFENNRALYDWVIDNVDAPSRPRQYEFARLNLSHTVTSKRKLAQLVEEGHVTGWDDPRFPTLAGMRRRGYPPESIRRFCDDVGVARANNLVAMAQLEATVRDDLNPNTRRAMVVLDPIKVVITNYPEGESETFNPPYLQSDVERYGRREVPFSKEVYIERTDYEDDPPPKYHRLAPGKEVRLRWGYVIRCDEVIKDDAGNVIELRCTYDPETGGGKKPEGRKVKGVIHWVPADTAVDVEVRLYGTLFSSESPDDAEDYRNDLNPNSLTVLQAKAEPSLDSASVGDRFQFERQGYFVADEESTPEKLVFNRTVTLRESF